jgi:AraC-like DNA-binding protein
VKTFKFNRKKYVHELLIDAAYLDELSSFVRTDTPYIIDFYEIVIVLEGYADVWIDQYKFNATEGTVLFTSPHSVRRTVLKNNFKAIVVLFEPSFFLHLFQDSEFLHRFRFFHSTSGEMALTLQTEQYNKVSSLLDDILNEFTDLKVDSEHCLRAITYQLLVILNRWFIEEKGQKHEESSTSHVTKFRALLERHFASDSSVSFYASALNISNNYLNVICKRHFGKSVKSLLEERRLREACKLLMYTSKSVKAIAFSLGYNDYSYFCRRFKQAFLVTAIEYRKQMLK